MKRVLVTGATGFIGRQTLPWLVQNEYDVHAVFSHSKPITVKNVHWHKVDLLKPGRPADLIKSLAPTHLLHMAWIATPGVYTESLDNLSWVSTSLEMLKAFCASGGKRVVVAGTCMEYDWKYGYCREKYTPMLPSTLYGTCKNSLHSMLQSMSLHTGTSFAWGRVFFLYGPYENPGRLVSSVILSLLQGREALCSAGEQFRDFLHVADVGRAFVDLLSGNVSGPINIASGQPVAVKELIQIIGDQLGCQNMIKLGALKTRTGEPHFLAADVSRLHNEVGFRPQHDLIEGITDTIDWWKRHLNQPSF